MNHTSASSVYINKDDLYDNWIRSSALNISLDSSKKQGRNRLRVSLKEEKGAKRQTEKVRGQSEVLPLMSNG